MKSFQPLLTPCSGIGPMVNDNQGCNWLTHVHVKKTIMCGEQTRLQQMQHHAVTLISLKLDFIWRETFVLIGVIHAHETCTGNLHQNRMQLYSVHVSGSRNFQTQLTHQTAQFCNVHHCTFHKFLVQVFWAFVTPTYSLHDNSRNVNQYWHKITHIQITNSMIEWTLHLSWRVAHSSHWTHAQRRSCNVTFHYFPYKAACSAEIRLKENWNRKIVSFQVTTDESVLFQFCFSISHIWNNSNVGGVTYSPVFNWMQWLHHLLHCHVLTSDCWLKWDEIVLALAHFLTCK